MSIQEIFVGDMSGPGNVRQGCFCRGSVRRENIYRGRVRELERVT